MLLPHGAVIALADGKTLELWRNAGTEIEPRLEALPAPRLDAHDHASGARHISSAANPSGNQIDEDAFAAAAAGWLNAEVAAHRIAQLVVVAPPRTLGELRRHYHKPLEAALLLDAAHDWLGRQPADLARALAGL
jgi:protein required for attachment to host cells